MSLGRGLGPGLLWSLTQGGFPEGKAFLGLLSTRRVLMLCHASSEDKVTVHLSKVNPGHRQLRQHILHFFVPSYYHSPV